MGRGVIVLSERFADFKVQLNYPDNALIRTVFLVPSNAISLAFTLVLAVYVIKEFVIMFL